MAQAQKATVKVLEPIVSKFIASGMGQDLDACDVSGKVRILRVECAVPKKQTADTFVIGRLPSGHTLFLGHLSMIEISEVPAETSFSVGLGDLQEPMGERLKASLSALVESKELKARQSLLGSLEFSKVKSVGQVDVLLTTSTPLPEGTVVRGFLAYSVD